jgi:hypothetical protein
MNTLWYVVVLREASSTQRVEVSPLVVNVEDVSFSFLRREREVLRKSFFVVSRNRVFSRGAPKKFRGAPRLELYFFKCGLLFFCIAREAFLLNENANLA